MRALLVMLWRFVREIAHDDAYERYLAHHVRAHGHSPALSRRAFYISDQHRKWTGVSRCC